MDSCALVPKSADEEPPRVWGDLELQDVLHIDTLHMEFTGLSDSQNAFER